jgi:hypothetical protein
MHPDIAYRLFGQRHAELCVEATHQRLLREARKARPGGRGRRRVDRWWWRILVSDHAWAE